MSFNTIRKIGSNIVPSQKSQKRFAARLRKLRWEIYHEEKSKVNILLEKYKTLIGEFLKKFKMKLKSHEVGIWKEKLNQTIMDATSPKKSNVKGNSYSMVNSLWFGGVAENVMNSKSLKKNERLIPEEIMRKLDDVLLKLTEVKSLLDGKDVPSKFVGNNSSMKDLDTEKVLDDMDKTDVDNDLDDVEDMVCAVNGAADVHNAVGGEDSPSIDTVAKEDVKDADAEKVLDVNPHRRRNVKVKKSLVTSEVAAMGKYAYKIIDARDKTKDVGDALDAVDDKDGGGIAATDVHNVVSGKDAQIDDAVRKEDATEAVLGVNLHAWIQGIGIRQVLDDYAVTGEGDTAFDEEVDNGDAIDVVDHHDPSKNQLKDEDSDMEEYSSDFADEEMHAEEFSSDFALDADSGGFSSRFAKSWWLPSPACSSAVEWNGNLYS